MSSHSHPILILDCESKSTFGFDVFVKPQRSNPREKSIAAAATLLRIRYRDFDHHNRKDPFEELLFILCSVQTQESSYRKTFRQLRRAFPRLSDLAAAPLREIEKPLVPGGLYRSKGRSIRAICRRIVRLYGRLSLAPLRKLSDQDAEEMLTSLPGVGLKVARCVMLYSLARKVFPVDTHCWRVCRRLGWVRSTKEGVCTRRDMNRLQAKIPSDLRFSLHVNLISLGREICRSDRPRCEVCPLGGQCRTGQRLQARGLAPPGSGRGTHRRVASAHTR